MRKSSGERCIYLDHHATTPLDPRVFEKITPYFTKHFGNAASAQHSYGWLAQDAVNEARIAFAQAINAHPTEIIFTSGATEATNLAIKGLFMPAPTVSGRHIVMSSIEHGATLSTIGALEVLGLSSTAIRPCPDGLITDESLGAALRSDTALVSLFLVNHEIGSINDVLKLASMTRKSGALFHCDATQALGRVKIDCQALPVDMMSFSGHKIYGPKGVGALYVRKEILPKLCPLIHGGGQEWCKRSGTLNVPGIVGLGEAARLAVLAVDKEMPKIAALRDQLLRNLSELDQIYINGSMKSRIAGNLNISFGGIDGEELMLSICSRVAVSTGSACASMAGGKSLVLEQLGVTPALRQATLRFGLGRFTTAEEIDIASELIIEQVKRQRHKATKKKTIKLAQGT